MVKVSLIAMLLKFCKKTK